MAFPWIAKIFLAITSDNVTILGSRRKVYLIINSSVSVFAIIMLMCFGIREGKVFIMVCVVTTQVCMTWCDAITDALVAQACRNDLKNGSSNLNSITSLAAAIGGIFGCLSAGFIELSNGEIDPNVYFGTYGFLIFILLVSSIFLNKKLEPEIIEMQRL